MDKNTQVAEIQLTGGGRLLIEGKSMTVSNKITLSLGTIEIGSGGSLTVATLEQTGGTIIVGAGATLTVTNFTQSGVMNQSGGTVTVSGSVTKAGGELNLSGGTFSVTNNFNLESGVLEIAPGGFSVTNTFNMTGGTVTLTTGSFSCANFSKSSGAVTLNSAASFTVGNNFSHTGGGSHSMNFGTKTVTIPGTVALTGGMLSNGGLEAKGYSQLFNMTMNNFTLVKNGDATAPDVAGGALGGSNVQFQNASAFSWTFQQNGPDNFTGDVIYHRSSTGAITIGSAIILQGMNVLPSLTVGGALTLIGDISTGSGEIDLKGNLDLSGMGGVTFGTGPLRFSGGANQSVTSDTPLSIPNLSLNKSGGNVMLNADVTITGDFGSNGGIVTFGMSSGSLRLAAGATTTVGSSSGHVDGSLNYEADPGFGPASLEFPIGAGGLPRPVKLDITFGGGPGIATFTAQLVNSAPPTYTLPADLKRVSELRHWVITCAGNCGAISNVSAQFDFRSNTEEGFPNEGLIRVVKSDGAGNWINLGGSASNNFITVSFTTFSEFALAEANAPLPVELTAFRATARGADVHLVWRTATETQNDYFVVEHSDGGGAFAPLGQVDGAGDSALPVDYGFVHAGAPAGVHYYRLRQVDFDGTFEYSPVVSATVGDAAPALRLYPNPAADEVRVTVPAGEGLLYTLFDAAGRELRRGPLADGRVGLGGLAPGTYVLRVTTAAGQPLAHHRLLKR